ncbi:hypothetical protein V8F33_002781 [Rhypophila sp. PSN 637]
MNSASSQAEEPPKNNDKAPRQHSCAPASPGNAHSPVRPNGFLEQRAHQSEHPTSPPARKDTNSSISTDFTATTNATVRSSRREDTAATTYSVAAPSRRSPGPQPSNTTSSPDSYMTSEPRVAAGSPRSRRDSINPAIQRRLLEAPAEIPTQAVFSVKDGSDVAAQRRPSRRRTGPLSEEQRRRAALIRKLGACTDCRKRRVACHPNHHQMTWEEAERKFLPPSPSLPGLAPLGGRPISPATSTLSRPILTQDPQEMDIDTSPSQQVGRSVFSASNDSRIRTPLPSGPRPDKPLGNSFKPEGLQLRASQLLADPHRSRYSKVIALLVHWQDHFDPDARSAVNELEGVLDQYNYTVQEKAIPSSSDGNKNPYRWLSREVTEFIDNDDHRNVLKVVYYNGYSYWDGKEMLLSSSKSPEPNSTIPWSTIQQLLLSATSDVLILLDSAYYPSLRYVKNKDKGVLELIAASASEDHVGTLGRSAFTRALSRQLRTRLSKRSALSAAELHARLLSNYSEMIEKQNTTSFPSPLHFQVSGTKLPSILLAPVPKGRSPLPSESPTSGGNFMNMTFRLSDEPVMTEEWVEWLRLMPEGIKEVMVKLEGANRDTFR